MKSVIKKNKKGQITQIILLFVVIFTITVTVLIGDYILDEVYSSLDDAGINTPAMTAAQNTIQNDFAVFDYGIVVLGVALIVGLMITSFLIPTHPIFIVINIIGIFILVFLGMVMSNVYGEIVSGTDQILGDQADDMPLSNYFVTRLPYLGAIVILLTSIIMYSRSVS
jgi:hypothetical protein